LGAPEVNAVMFGMTKAAHGGGGACWVRSKRDAVIRRVEAPHLLSSEAGMGHVSVSHTSCLEYAPVTPHDWPQLAPRWFIPNVVWCCGGIRDIGRVVEQLECWNAAE
jgi:hypothetical protein